MISADVLDVKANKNNKKKKIWWLYLTNFYKKYLQNLKYGVKFSSPTNSFLGTKTTLSTLFCGVRLKQC